MSNYLEMVKSKCTRKDKWIVVERIPMKDEVILYLTYFGSKYEAQEYVNKLGHKGYEIFERTYQNKYVRIRV